jgi:hypothetical protein
MTTATELNDCECVDGLTEIGLRYKGDTPASIEVNLDTRGLCKHWDTTSPEEEDVPQPSLAGGSDITHGGILFDGNVQPDEEFLIIIPASLYEEPHSCGVWIAISLNGFEIPIIPVDCTDNILGSIHEHLEIVSFLDVVGNYCHQIPYQEIEEPVHAASALQPRLLQVPKRQIKPTVVRRKIRVLRNASNRFTPGTRKVFKLAKVKSPGKVVTTWAQIKKRM